MATLFKKYYYGQDLHVVRNGATLNLHEFFDLGGWDMSFSFLLNGAEISQPSSSSPPHEFENVEYKATTNLATVKASITLPLVLSVSCFYLKALVYDAGTVIREYYVLVHIHDYVSSMWLSPQTLTLYDGCAGSHFGIMAKFNDDIIADVSWYKYTYALHSPPTYITTDSPSTGDLFVTTPPGTASHTDIFQISSFDYFSTLPSFPLKGNVNIIELKVDTILPINPTTVSQSMNILIMGDGFSTAEVTSFDTYVAEIAKQMNVANSTSPWNLFKINFWKCFLPGESDMCNYPGDYVILSQTGTNYVAIPLQKYVKHCNDIIDNIISASSTGATWTGLLTGLVNKFTYLSYSPPTPSSITHPILSLYNILNAYVLTNPSGTISSIAPNRVNLSWLISHVGLPGNCDIDKTIDIKTDEWRTAYGTLAPPYLFAIGTEHSGTQSAPKSPMYLHRMVFEMWRKMYLRFSIGYTDTTIGVARIFCDSEKEPSYQTYNLNGGKKNDNTFFGITVGNEKMMFSNIRLTEKLTLNKIISKLSTDSTHVLPNYNIGGEFFTSGGLINSSTKDANNVIVLSKINPTEHTGNNNIPNIDGNLIVTALHNTVTDANNNTREHINCSYVGNDIVPTGIALPAVIDPEVRNRPIHEFSHNYLEDEYGAQGTDIYSTSYTPAQIAFFESRILNTNLITHHQVSVSPTVSSILKEKIIWGQWPRITAIGRLASPPLLISGTTYHVAINETDTPFGFNTGDMVTFRTVDLFAAHTYPVLQVMDYDEATHTYQLQLQSGTIDSSYVAQSLMMRIRWDDTTSSYQTLMHKDVLTILDGQNDALVNEDDGAKGVQQPKDRISGGGLSIKNFTVPQQKELIVGLYGGGFNRFAKHVYHPTGYCLMRSSGLTSYLCPVCKYIIVDKVNPMKHPIIDAEYEVNYPKY